MKKRVYIIASFVFIFLFIGCDIKNAVDHPDMIQSEEDESLFPFDTQVLQQRTLSGDPPRTPVNLRELVLELQDATPIANQTDFDLDGICWKVLILFPRPRGVVFSRRITFPNQRLCPHTVLKLFWESAGLELYIRSFMTAVL